MTNARATMTAGFLLGGRLSLTGTGATAPGVTLQKWVQAAWAAGTGTGQVDNVAAVERTLAASDWLELDLFGALVLDSAGATLASLINLAGEAVGLQKLRAFQVQLLTGSVGLRIGGAATNPHTLWFAGTTPTHDIEAGGTPFVAGGATGKTVSSTARRVRILNLNGAGTCSFRAAIAGLKV